MEDCPIELLGLEIGKGWFPLVKPIIDRVQDLNSRSISNGEEFLNYRIA